MGVDAIPSFRVFHLYFFSSNFRKEISFLLAKFSIEIYYLLPVWRSPVTSSLIVFTLWQSRFNLNFQVNVHVTLSHGEQFSYVHSPSALWVQSVTTSGFKVCVRESGTPSNGSGIINWLAFQDRPDITHGSVSFNGYWTTETRCEKISFSQVRLRMQSPYTFVRIHECCYLLVGYKEKKKNHRHLVRQTVGSTIFPGKDNNDYRRYVHNNRFEQYSNPWFLHLISVLCI